MKAQRPNFSSRPAFRRSAGRPGGLSSTGLARALSKLGYCSRSQAWELIQSGRVRLNGLSVRDPERPVRLSMDRIEVDGKAIHASRKVYLALNKPRGLVTTAADERGRGTVYECLDGAGLPHLSPVGRLDQASEGLLLFTNDSQWAARITAPQSEVSKVYHVQIDKIIVPETLRQFETGREVDGETLQVKSASVLRQGARNCWVELRLCEGRNRHIRRLMAAFGIEVLRLVRVSIGQLQLGDLPKGCWRNLTPAEVRSLA